MKTVLFDAGHGIHTPGKRTPDDEREWTFNDIVVRAAINRMKQYEGVKIIRLDDPTGKTDIPLEHRAPMPESRKADALVSVHHNANTGKWGDWTGTETYVQTPLSANPKSHALAKQVHPRLVKAMGLKDRGIKTENFHMLREAKYKDKASDKYIGIPAILTEGGYMDSRIDIKALRDKKRLENAGIAIADGVAAYLGLKLEEKNPKPPAVKPPPKLDPPKGKKIGTATMLQDVQAYARPAFGTQTKTVFNKGTVRHIYAIENGWYKTFSGEYIPSNYGKNFTYVPEKPGKPPNPTRKRQVTADGKPTGTFTEEQNVLKEVERAMKAKAKTIEIKEVK